MQRQGPDGYSSSELANDEPVLTRQLSDRQLIALDAAAAGAYGLALLTLAFRATANGGLAVPGPAVAAVVFAMAAPLAARRLRPALVFGVVLGASAIGFGLGIVRDGFIGPGFALYIVAIDEGPIARRPTLGVAAIAIVGLALLVAAGGPRPVASDAGPLLVGIVVLAGSWTIGRAVRERRRFAGRTAAQLAEQAVAEERLRIARDLHDVVAHGLSLIVIKAATANHVIDARPQEAREALTAIEATGRSALAEMRRMLGVLREGDPVAETPDLAPAPGFDELSALAERVASAGVKVDLRLSGTEGVPDGVALSIYRIVQEALTNVVKHSAPAHCRVAVSVVDGSVLVDIEDDGAHAGLSERMDGSGQGLIGMRERVRALGGEFSAGPRSPRGFRVAARIPCGALADPAPRPSG